METLKKIKVVLMVLLSSMLLTNVKSQNVVDFDTLFLEPDTFWNGSDLSGGFSDGGVYFVNYYDTSYGGYWSGGFAYSNMVDTVTAGYTNMYSVMAGEAQSDSNFAIANPNYNTAYMKLASPANIDGMYVTNSTYAYISMRDGDSFAKKFGGDSGDDPDWFKLTMKGYLNGSFTDSVEFYLADYRFTDNSQDYIVKDWTWVDMTPMGNVDSVVFTLSSSDVGQYGMNTPAYFCLDHIQYTTTGINQQNNEMSLQVYPNPATDKIFVEAASKITKLELRAIDGKMLMTKTPNTMKTIVNINNLPNGIYFLSLSSERGVVNKKIIKE